MKLEKIDHLVITVKDLNKNTDIIFGFVPVTLHEYLIINYAQARKIPIRLLRSTKIDNYISLNDNYF